MNRTLRHTLLLALALGFDKLDAVAVSTSASSPGRTRCNEF